MQDFIYNALPARVIFGVGTLSRVEEEIRRLGCRRALLLATPQQQDSVRALADSLGELAVGVFTEATMHTPVEVTLRGMAAVAATEADCLVALGGGSTTGLGKALALRTDLPQIVIPTTYAGSEATPILGQTENGVKTTLRSLKVLPEVIIYDVTLTKSLPLSLSVTSGINAIAHAVEALYSAEANPMISQLAEQGTAAIAKALPALAIDLSDEAARSDALFGAWACGTCLGAVGMSLHHKLCHAIGGSFDLPHAETHTVVLPHVVAFNMPAAPAAMRHLEAALGGGGVARRLYDLAAGLGAPTSLAALGLRQSALDEIAEAATSAPYPNPRPVTREAVRAILQAAFDGRAP